MQVRGQRVHDGDLLLLGAHHACGLLLDGLLDADPGAAIAVVEMRVDRALAPDLNLFFDVAGDGLGKEAEGVTAEVDAGVLRVVGSWFMVVVKKGDGVQGV